MNLRSRLLRENLFTPLEVSAFERKLFFEGARRRPYLERFSALLFLATIIATAGIISDSTATVIGAMIVAPLMTPIMAMAAALVMGQMGRAIQSSLLVAAGVASVIAVSWLIGTLYPHIISFQDNSQITARIAPRLLDLLAALASGAAGAFCMSREDIADSLPGVAIAISLVPPLCVVGISLSYGEMDAALGALLLFVTNMLAILLAGGGVLALLDLSRASTTDLPIRARRNAFIAIIIGVLVVSVPLWLTGHRVVREVRAEYTTRQLAEGWVAGSDFRVRTVQVVGPKAYILVSGPGETPPFESLATSVLEALGPETLVELEVVPSQTQVSPGARAVTASGPRG